MVRVPLGVERGDRLSRSASHKGGAGAAAPAVCEERAHSAPRDGRSRLSTWGGLGGCAVGAAAAAAATAAAGSS